MCEIKKQIEELQCQLTNLAKKLTGKTETIKYKLTKQAGNDCWWDVHELKNGYWIEIDTIVDSFNGQYGAEAKFKKLYLAPRVVKEYTCEQWC